MCASKIFFRLAIALFALMVLLLAALVLIPTAGHRPPPLPFDTNGYVCTIDWTAVYKRKLAHLPPQPTFMDRVYFVWNNARLKLGRPLIDPRKVTISAYAGPTIGVRNLLDQSAMVSEGRYFISTNVANKMIPFKTSKILNGQDWIDTAETALKNATVRHAMITSLLSPNREMEEGIVLIRYPEQKTVLVLPASAAKEFRRTNSTGVIDPPRP